MRLESRKHDIHETRPAPAPQHAGPGLPAHGIEQTAPSDMGEPYERIRAMARGEYWQ